MNQGEKILLWLHRNKFNIKTLADKSGVNGRTITRIIEGHNTQTETLEKLAKAMDMSLSELQSNEPLKETKPSETVTDLRETIQLQKKVIEMLEDKLENCAAQLKVAEEAVKYERKKK